MSTEENIKTGKGLKKYYSLVGLKVDYNATWMMTTYTIEWER